MVQIVSRNMSLNGTNYIEEYVTKWYKLYRGMSLNGTNCIEKYVTKCYKLNRGICH